MNSTLNMDPDCNFSSIPALRKPKCITNTKKSSYLSLTENEKPKISENCDLSTMEFSQVVQNLRPNCVSIYLERILDFLTENDNEMCFHDTVPHKLAFLEKIATNTDNLKKDCFDEKSKHTASKIIGLLENNKSVYRLGHFFENGKSNQSVLIYRKLFSANIYEKNKHQCPAKPITAKCPRSGKDEIPESFKEFWLNQMLAFTKDTARQSLEYPIMAEHLGEFIKSMIWKPGHSMEDEQLKTFCAPLWEAMKILSLKYEFWLSSEKVENDSVALLLTKIPKLTRLKNSSVDGSHNSARSGSERSPPLRPAARLPAPAAAGETHNQLQSDGSRDSARPGSERPPQPRPAGETHNQIQSARQLPTPPPLPKYSSKKNKTSQKLIYSQSAEFLEKVLNQLLVFLEDTQQASIVFPKTSARESLFLERIYSMFKSPDSIDLFPDEHRGLLKKISNVFEKQNNLYLEVVLGKRPAKSVDPERLRDVTFKKAIKTGKLKCLGPPVQLPRESPGGPAPGGPAPGGPAPGAAGGNKPGDRDNPFLKAISVSSDSVVCDTASKERERVNQNSREPSVSSTGSAESKRKPKISFACAGAGQLDLTDQSTHSGQSSDRSRSRDRLSAAKKKMLEALAVPVQCGKAERMMQLMGWRGGALGARGEGITEPILPALQIKSGAGFGHVAPLKPAAKTAEEVDSFVSDLLDDLLRLARGEGAARQYAGLSEKMQQAVRSVIRSCNRRKVNGKLRARDTSKLRALLEALAGTPTAFQFNVHNNQNNITITKTSNPDFITKTIKEKKSKKSLPKEPDDLEEAPDRKEQDYKIKVDLLRKIIDFVKGELDSCELSVTEQHPSSCFYKKLFASTVAVANKAAPVVYSKMEDYGLYKELVETVKGFYLEVIADDNERLFTLNKRYRKRFTNSSLQPSTLNLKADTKPVTRAADEAKGTSPDADKPKHEDGDDEDEDCTKDLKVEIYEDDWLNCCSDNSHESVRDAKETDANRYVIENVDVDKVEHSKILIPKEENDYKAVRIVPVAFPNEKLDAETVIRLQNAFIDRLKNEVTMPQLQCFGIQDGGLVYSCRNENTYLFLNDFIETFDVKLKVIDIPNINPDSYDLEFKINSFIQNSSSETLNNFEAYNNGLRTKNWKVLEVDVKENCLVTKVSVDSGSYKYIRERGFCLELGFDRALFRLAW